MTEHVPSPPAGPPHADGCAADATGAVHNPVCEPADEHASVTEYRVRETQTVTDDSLSRILNEETRTGWIFDGMTFVPNEASKRPKMAFLIFTRERPPHAHTHALPSPRTSLSGHEP